MPDKPETDRTGPQRTVFNRPGAPANPPQHIFDESEASPNLAGINRNTHEQLGQPSGEATAPPSQDVADPHAATHDHYERVGRPGGQNTVRTSAEPNPSMTTGEPEPRPDNVETTPPRSGHH